jgi:hypothetical protein
MNAGRHNIGTEHWRGAGAPFLRQRAKRGLGRLLLTALMSAPSVALVLADQLVSATHELELVLFNTLLARSRRRSIERSPVPRAPFACCSGRCLRLLSWPQAWGRWVSSRSGAVLASEQMSLAVLKLPVMAAPCRVEVVGVPPVRPRPLPCEVARLRCESVRTTIRNVWCTQ